MYEVKQVKCLLIYIVFNLDNKEKEPMDELLLKTESTRENDAYDRLVEENFNRRILVLNDEINEAVMENYVLFILNWNCEDTERGIPIKKRRPIKLYISSPGGDSFDGSMLIDVIKSSSTPIIGVAFGLVASMGYHIYLACHERLAFSNTIFCQHDGEIAIANSSSKAKDIVRFFDKMDGRFKQHVLDNTIMTEEFYDEKYQQEFYFYADEEGKELGIVHKIIGKDCKIDYLF